MNWNNKFYELCDPENSEAAKELLEHCQEWTQAFPNDAHAWESLGYAYNRSQLYAQSIEACQQALYINQGFAEAFANLGFAYDRVDKKVEAIDAYEKYLALVPDNESVWKALGHALLTDEIDQPVEALKAIDMALTFDANDQNTWFLKGTAYCKLKKYSDAALSFKKVIKLGLKCPFIWCRLGDAYCGLKKYPAAIKAYKTALKIDSKYTKAWHALGLASIAHGTQQLTDALQQADYAIEKLTHLDLGEAIELSEASKSLK